LTVTLAVRLSNWFVAAITGKPVMLICAGTGGVGGRRGCALAGAAAVAGESASASRAERGRILHRVTG
jgi:hypothetical protein